MTELSPATASQPLPTGAPWARRFFTVWGAQSVAVVGNRLVQFALVWWITSTTGSAAALASATLFVMLPSILIGPFAGALIDRMDRRRIMMAADGLTLAVTGILAYVAWTGRLQVWHIYAVVLVRSAAEQFAWTSLQSSTSLMVPGEQLARMAGVNQTVQGVMNLIAPALGAVLVSAIPLHGVMGVQMALTVVAITVLGLSRIPQPATRATRPNLVQDVREGFQFVWAWKGLRTVILLASGMAVLSTPTMSLMPLFVTQHLKGGALHLGWLQSATGLAFIVGGLILGAWGGFQRRIVTTMMGLVGSGTGTLIMAGAPEGAFGIALAGSVFGGLMNGFVNAPFMAIMQSSVPAGIQGRVFTVTQSLNQAATPIGLALAAPVADLLGIRVLYLISGVAVIGMGVAMRMSSAVMHIEDGVGWSDRPAPAQDTAGAGLPVAGGSSPRPE